VSTFAQPNNNHVKEDSVKAATLKSFHQPSKIGVDNTTLNLNFDSSNEDNNFERVDLSLGQETR
jgi:hypothetical protein